MLSAILRGGLGNQLFITAHVIAHSLRYNIPYCIEAKVENPHDSDPNFYSLPFVNYSDSEINLPLFNEREYTYTELPFIDNVKFSGYFQSWKYFDQYRKEILELFGFDKIKNSGNFCAIHYRFGDYVKFPTIHPIISKEYLNNAIAIMKDSGYENFLVFSDSVDESKKVIEQIKTDNKGFCNLKFTYGKGDALTTLKAIAACNAIVMSNSTFSFWSQYINPNPDKLVTAPKKWFGEAMNHDTKDLYQPHFIII